MSFIAFGGEKRVADLVTRIYGKLKAADAKRAAAALVSANPGLARIELVGRGRPISVPDVPGIAERSGSASSSPIVQGVEGLRAGVDQFAKEMGEADERERRDIDETLALLEQDDLRRVVEGNAVARELLERVARATEQRAADVKVRAAFMKRLKKADAELSALARSRP